MKRVAIYRRDLLPVSESFISDQASSLQAWDPILLGVRDIRERPSMPKMRFEVVPQFEKSLTASLNFWLSRPNSHVVDRLKRLKINLVHAHFGTDATDVWPSVRSVGLPLLVTLHGYDINVHRQWWEQGYGGLRRRLYPRRLLRMAQDPAVHFIAVSNAIKNRAIDYGVPSNKISVHYSGVDTNIFRFGPIPIGQRSKKILFIGRMVDSKNPFFLIKTFSRLKSMVPDTELTIIGDGPLLIPAQRLAEELGVHVNFLGSRPRKDVVSHLWDARVLCLPSAVTGTGAAEGLGQVLLEAQSSGVPVVAARTGGIPEAVIDGQTGHLFTPQSEEDFLEKLIKITALPAETLDGMSISCRNFVLTKFDLRKQVEKLEGIYDALVPL